MDTTVAKSLNDFFSLTLSANDREEALDFFTDFFHSNGGKEIH